MQKVEERQITCREEDCLKAQHGNPDDPSSLPLIKGTSQGEYGLPLTFAVFSGDTWNCCDGSSSCASVRVCVFVLPAGVALFVFYGDFFFVSQRLTHETGQRPKRSSPFFCCAFVSFQELLRPGASPSFVPVLRPKTQNFSVVVVHRPCCASSTSPLAGHALCTSVYISLFDSAL